eukprot:TRINITY_DN3934_c0_g1_i5.p1 TRINITY_DN3934_c0_g1~~TRINITY_DN3934_c0_g1_i5.p1  ORF type:complete len:202 (-),score=45.64 TRINITY_DN3934_c0_g1_i5:276-881(-)
MKEFRIQLTFILALEQKFKGDSPSMEEFLNAQKLAEEFAEEYGRTLKLYPFIIKRIAYLSYSKNKETEKAIETYNQSIESLKKIFNESNIEIAKIYNEIGQILIKEQKYEEALNNFQQGMQIWKSIYGEKDTPLSAFYNKLNYNSYNLLIKALPYVKQNYLTMKKLFKILKYPQDFYLKRMIYNLKRKIQEQLILLFYQSL